MAKQTVKAAPPAEKAPWAATAACWAACFVMPLAAWWVGADPGVSLRLVVLGVTVGLALVFVIRNRRAVATARSSHQALSPQVLSRQVLSPQVLWAGLAGLAVVAVCSLTSATPWLSLLGRYPRYEGLPMLAAYLVVVLLGAWLVGQDAPARRGHALTALALLQVVLALWAVIQTVASPNARVTTPLGNASDLGVIAVTGFAVLGWFAVQESHWLVWTGAVSAAVTVGLTASRGTWIGCGAVVVAGCAILVVRKGWRRAWPMAVLLAVGALVVAIVPMARSRGLGTSPLADQTATGRLILWRETLRLWLDHPWLGVGPSRFVDEINGYNTPEWARVVGPDAPPDSPHNVILQVMASCGVLGLAVAVVFAVVLARTLWRARQDDWAVGAFLALVGVLGCYGFHFTDLPNIGPLLFVVGGACAVPGMAPPGPSKRLVKRTGVGLPVVGLVGVLAVGLGGQGMITEARLNGGVAQLQTGDASGTAALQRAVRLKPQDPDMAWRAGHALMVMAGAGFATAQDAVDMLAPACVRLPHSVECLDDLALAYLRGGQADAANTAVQQALQLDPTNMTTLLINGSARDALGDQAGAEAAFLQAATLRPSSPLPWQNLAALYTEEGRQDDAKAAQAKADALS